MKILAFAAALFSIAAFVVAKITGNGMVLILAVTAMACAFTTFRSASISSFLKIFVAIFTTELVVFGSVYLAERLNWWPAKFAEYRLPASLALTVAMFSILVYALSFVPLVRVDDAASPTAISMPASMTTAQIWPLPAFRALERRVATWMVVFLVLINQAEVGMLVRLNFFSRDWFNAIQTKDEKTFWYQLFFVFLVWAFIYIASVVTEFVVQSTLLIRWRKWLTNYYVDHWLDRHTHYRMSLLGYAADNPDQRISEDIYRFIDGGRAAWHLFFHHPSDLESDLACFIRDHPLESLRQLHATLHEDRGAGIPILGRTALCRFRHDHHPFDWAPASATLFRQTAL